MNADVKQKWIAALRSGDYVQGVGALRQRINDEDLFCCLGVLCDLHAREVGGTWKDRSACNSKSYLSGFICLPQQVCEWAGLLIGPTLLPNVNVTIDALGGEPRTRTLANRNDCGVTFTEIADIIEAQL